MLKRNNLLLLAVVMLVSACELSPEQYERRVAYCRNHGMKVEVELNPSGTVKSMVCVNSDGHKFWPQMRRGE